MPAADGKRVEITAPAACASRNTSVNIGVSMPVPRYSAATVTLAIPAVRACRPPNHEW
jgi:hypothetical protein